MCYHSGGNEKYGADQRHSQPTSRAIFRRPSLRNYLPSSLHLPQCSWCLLLGQLRPQMHVTKMFNSAMASLSVYLWWWCPCWTWGTSYPYTTESCCDRMKKTNSGKSWNKNRINVQAMLNVEIIIIYMINQWSMSTPVADISANFDATIATM